MNLEAIQNIFSIHGLPQPENFTKIEVGFTNTVYSVDDKYILKICSDIDNKEAFKLEAQLYRHFQGLLPVPRLVAYDDTEALIPNNYMLYPRIEGENLYNVWHDLSDDIRKSLIKQLCEMLKAINKADISKLLVSTSLKQPTSWKEVVLNRIIESYAICQRAGTISGEEVKAIEQFVADHSHCLDEARMALVYWDAHFDNILVKGGTIVGLLDFERTEIASIDFALDIVKRMVEFPKKYMSEYAEQFAKDEDYANLLEWYKEFYPELFNFNNLDRRLDLYSIAHDLEDLENWPQVSSLKENILKIVA